MFAAVGVGSGLALVPAGMLVDRHGARRILLAGGTITAAGLIGAAFAPNVYWYGAMLFVAGVGGAGVPVAGMTSLLREFAPEQRGMALGWRQLAVPLGGAIGSVALPALVTLGGLQLAMLFSAVTAGGLAFAFSAVAGDDRSEVRSRGLGGVLSIPQMRQLLTVGFLYVWALGGVLAYYIPAAESGGLSATQAAIGFTVVNITAALSRIVWGRLADKNSGTRRIHVLRATGLVAGAGAVLMPIALATGTVTSLAATVALAFGVFGFNGVLYLTAGEIAGADRAGRAVGLASMVVFGWGSLSAPIAGLAIEATGYDAVWVIAAVTGIAGALVAGSMLRSTQTSGGTHTRWMGRSTNRWSHPRVVIMAGGMLAVMVAFSIGVDDTAVLTVALSGATSAALGWRMSRLRPGALQNLYAWACCIFGATTAGQGYLTLDLGATGAPKVEAVLWIVAGLMVIGGATATMLVKPHAVAGE